MLFFSPRDFTLSLSLLRRGKNKSLGYLILPSFLLILSPIRGEIEWGL